ncbi:MAG: putative selenate reductase subunit YgfK [Sphaerochaetaceae bacterium]|nr:putative selenate reductase subunit YgfK [Sphaerochaetaceae bacterium]
MGDKMRPVPFQELMERVFTEYRNHESIFGIHKDSFYSDGGHGIEVFGQKCATPLGPAAGPHTQLAQNIIASYLVGGRFMELKTVQIMDYLGERNMIAKPCIDARDECHNVEWSTEYTLPMAYDEYLKAWFVLHVLHALMTGKKEPDFIFNMSVGYNLEGIKEPKMQTYINGMMDARTSPLFEEYKEQLKALIEEGEFFAGTDFEKNAKALKGLVDSISPNICPSTTISTMHGCPPKEIEAICSYMLTEKHLNTFVKLNPTLLGYDKVREILDSIGFEHVGLRRETFEHDLQFPDAVAMLHRLVKLAEKEKLGFGVKLTNTLANINDGSVLPGEERYMSGRALMPASITVAAKLSEEFEGKLPISYSGGATAFTVKDIFDTGIRPITLATDMLKPGGYSRMKQMAEILDKESGTWGKKDIDSKAVRELAETAKEKKFLQKDFRGFDKAKADDELPLFNCYIAPCKEACPIHQDIPDYVSLVGEGRYAEALAVIYEDNALPNITCNICDHQCQFHCSRMDYEGPVQIRQMKKIAVEKGTKEYMKMWEAPEDPTDIKAAVVGAGPAGLSAAYFLARSGFDTTIYEKAPNAGGVVANIIPKFRIAPEAVQADIDFVKAHGVKFVFDADRDDTTVAALKKAGYDYIYYAVGAEKDNEIKIEGDTSAVLGSLEFLEKFMAGEAKLGAHVVVTGGGNTAMDCARAAIRCKGVKDVSVVYRRSKKEMPADPEEFEMAMEDGVKFYFLNNPKAIENGKLTCSTMKLGEPDASGRRRPVETGETIILDCDNLITAIGEHAAFEEITWYGIPCNEKGWPKVNKDTNETEVEGVYAVGDMASGPSTVVRCIASARKAVEATLDKVLSDDESVCDCGNPDCDGTCEECDSDYSDEEEGYEEAEDKFFRDIQDRKTHLCVKAEKVCKDMEQFAKQESKRCMDCTYLCNKCVDVCPNRANVAIDMRFSEYSDDPFQILHIDAYCNECGNCATFCNHNGKPYRDKFTVFNREDDFENSTNNGFIADADQVKVRLFGNIINCHIDGEGHLIGAVPPLVRDMIEQVYFCYDYLLNRVD